MLQIFFRKMDISKFLKTVNNVDDYISATEKMLSDHSNSKIQFNMSTVLALKKVRSIEIEVKMFFISLILYVYLFTNI